MIKKIILGTAFIAVVVILALGAINRTNHSLGNESFGEGAGRRGGWEANQGQTTTGLQENLAVPQEKTDNEFARGNQGNRDNEGTSKGNGGNNANRVDVNGAGYEKAAGDQDAHAEIAALPLEPGELTQEEIDGLLWMREEEKLARDVYQKLYSIWGQQTFANIANSEQTHMDAVLTLLEGYGVADPVGDAAAGEFTNPDLQALYDQLVEQGSKSLADALKVGAAIEEIDIIDLRKWAEETENTSIEAVYTNLENGSENHLRSFTKVLSRQGGETYQPQYLSSTDYQAIVK